MKWHSSISNIRKFVDINPSLDLNLSLYFDLEGVITPWILNYEHSEMPGSNHINLYLAYPSSMDGVTLADGHFMLVTDLDGFLKKKLPCGQLNKRHHCPDCLRAFSRKIYLEEHKGIYQILDIFYRFVSILILSALCSNKHGLQQLMPEEGQTLSLTNH